MPRKFESETHWLAAAINRARAGALPLNALPASVDSIDAWNILHRNHGMSFQSIAEAVASSYGLQVVDARELKRVEDNPFSERLCRKLNVFPFDLGAARAVVATCDPRLTADQRQQIRFLLGKDFELAIVSPDSFDTALTFLYAAAPERGGNKPIDLTSRGVGENDTVQLAKAMFREAIDRRASDIHIHPFVGGAAIRFRIDGILVRIATVPRKSLESIANYLNAQAELESNPFIPQDGRISLRYGARNVDVRLSLLPAFDGMRIVCRLLEQGRQFSLSRSGFTPADCQALRRLIDWGAGIVLLTGPTGSGKTSTLYALLMELNTTEVNILTLEDPVEYLLPGISQVQVNEVQGRSFAETLRATLRQDPDVVLVGEIRDKETAQVAAQASLTGHLVLSTLHTNDAIATIPRLLDLGLDPTILADALIGVVSQRLVRRLCPRCKTAVADPLSAFDAEFLRITKETPRYRAVGCEECGFSGYHGRVPVTEILEVSPAMRAALLDGSRDVQSLRAANEGFQTSMVLGAAGWIVSGETTPEEVHRELGLRFWNELATRHRTQLSGTLAGHQRRSGHRPGILLLSDREGVAVALENELDLDIVLVATEAAAAEALRKSDAIIAIVVDSALLRVDPEGWLRSLRAQLAWSGVPVLFLTRPGADDLKRILAEFNVREVMVEQGKDPGALIAHEVAAILGTRG